MAILAEKINSTILKIERPVASGPGGDPSLHLVLDQRIEAIREGVNRTALAGFRLEQDPASVELLDEETFWVDLLVAPDEIRSVRSGDLITWESHRDRGEDAPAAKRSVVIRATIWDAPGTAIENIEILTRGSGVGYVPGA